MKSVRRAYDPRPLWQRRLSADSAFCRAVVTAGYLSQEHMLRAAHRYRLGCSRDGGVIFWQIDQMVLIWDGKIMYYRPDCHRDHSRHPNWVSHLLKVHYGCQHLDIPTAHCLFGLHLLSGLSDDQTVCVVESEKTAVILSEAIPDCVWLATGGLHELKAVKLLPLRHYRVVLFPDTDEHHQAYSLWYETVQKARRLRRSLPRQSPLRAAGLARAETPKNRSCRLGLPQPHSRAKLARSNLFACPSKNP